MEQTIETGPGPVEQNQATPAFNEPEPIIGGCPTDDEIIEAARPVGEYVSGAEYDVRITVRWLVDNTDYGDEDPNRGHYVHLCIETWAVDGTDFEPDHWQVDFFHYVGLISSILDDYLKRWCPYPERVWEVADQLPLPLELKGLFRRSNEI